MNARHVDIIHSTAGPWKLSESGVLIVAGTAGTERRIHVAQIVEDGVCAPTPREAQANAELISSAPDLAAEVARLRAALAVAESDCDTIASNLVAGDYVTKDTEQQAQLLAGVAMRLRAALSEVSP